MTPRDRYTCEWVECLHETRGRSRQHFGKTDRTSGLPNCLTGSYESNCSAVVFFGFGFGGGSFEGDDWRHVVRGGASAAEEMSSQPVGRGVAMREARRADLREERAIAERADDSLRADSARAVSQ